MNTVKRWLVIPIAIAILLGTAKVSFGQQITVSPGSQPIQVSGTSGGNQKDNGCAGYISTSPNHVVQVTEDADLRFVLQGAGQPALLIRSSTGQNFCVPADSYSGGKVEIPGRWRKGTYSVYVGDRANGHHSYTLLISQSQ
ncbi:MAG: hypothetical protein HC866_02030 [Leptolyngbyaceae cyanobacterium RU_5_1]|nr:hypothetical protein [Leptolyngbyaceae cyanobacterium RU_5_1]